MLLLFELPFPLLLLQFVGGVVQLVLVVSEGHMIIVVMVWNDLGSWRLVHGRCAVRMQGLLSSVGYRMHRDWFMHDRVMGVNVLRFGMMGFCVVLWIVVIADICARIDNMGHLCRRLSVAAGHHYPWGVSVLS